MVLDLRITIRNLLDANSELKAKIAAIYLADGKRIRLGYAKTKSFPQMVLFAPSQNGRADAVRWAIPHQWMRTLQHRQNVPSERLSVEGEQF
jgi:hypothetical protein